MNVWPTITGTGGIWGRRASQVTGGISIPIDS